MFLKKGSLNGIRRVVEESDEEKNRQIVEVGLETKRCPSNFAFPRLNLVLLQSESFRVHLVNMERALNLNNFQPKQALYRGMETVEGLSLERDTLLILVLKFVSLQTSTRGRFRRTTRSCPKTSWRPPRRRTRRARASWRPRWLCRRKSDPRSSDCGRTCVPWRAVATSAASLGAKPTAFVHFASAQISSVANSFMWSYFIVLGSVGSWIWSVWIHEAERRLDLLLVTEKSVGKSVS